MKHLKLIFLLIISYKSQSQNRISFGLKEYEYHESYCHYTPLDIYYNELDSVLNYYCRIYERKWFNRIQIDSSFFLNDKLVKRYLHDSFTGMYEQLFKNEYMMIATQVDSSGLLQAISYFDFRVNKGKELYFCPYTQEIISEMDWVDTLCTGIEYSYFLKKDGGGVFSIKNYKNGIQTGEERKYYSNGNLSKLQNYDLSGKLHGIVYEYWENGAIALIASYSHGVKEGWIYTYLNDGSLYTKVYYKNGVVSSP